MGLFWKEYIKRVITFFRGFILNLQKNKYLFLLIISFVVILIIYFYLGKITIFYQILVISKIIKYFVMFLFFTGNLYVLYIVFRNVLRENLKIKLTFFAILIFSIIFRSIFPMFQPRWLMILYYYSFRFFTPLDWRGELAKFLTFFFDTVDKYILFYTVLGSFTNAIIFLSLYKITKKYSISLLSSIFISIHPWWVLANRTIEYSNLALFYFTTLFYGISIDNLSVILISIILGAYSRPEFCVFLPFLFILHIIINRKNIEKIELVISVLSLILALFPFYLYVTFIYSGNWDYQWFKYYASTISEHVINMLNNLQKNFYEFVNRYIIFYSFDYRIFWFYFLSTFISLFMVRNKKLALLFIYWIFTFIYYLLFGQGLQDTYRFSLNNAFPLFLVSPYAVPIILFFVKDFYLMYSKTLSLDFPGCDDICKYRYYEFLDALRIRNNLENLPIVVDRYSLFPYYLGKKFKYAFLPESQYYIKNMTEFYIYLDCYSEEEDRGEHILRFDMKKLLEDLKDKCSVEKIYLRDIGCLYGLYHVKCK